MLVTVAAADSASTVRKKYSVFIYSDEEPHAMYAIYKQTLTLCVLQYTYRQYGLCLLSKHEYDSACFKGSQICKLLPSKLWKDQYKMMLPWLSLSQISTKGTAQVTGPAVQVFTWTCTLLFEGNAERVCPTRDTEVHYGISSQSILGQL